MKRPRTYDGTSITVTYHAHRCIHAEECARGLPSVFDPAARPWVNPDAASADETAEVILRCPTGALQYRRHDGGPEETARDTNTAWLEVDGPLYVRGDVELKGPDHDSVRRETRIAFCRCGASNHKPFCDGSHDDAGFADAAAVGRGPQVDSRSGGHGTLTVTAVPNGPLLVNGHVALHAADGSVTHYARAAWCRCGGSASKPFCDGSHKTNGFSSENP